MAADEMKRQQQGGGALVVNGQTDLAICSKDPDIAMMFPQDRF